ncbi:BppU family phage baseplate upper protein [[Clostridium] symbiosum]|uniref:BppU family phage baseplate upper protein n=1 Tax=Clostridium symbiosum TaxID=1512 RepID=A0AAW6B0J6_CLOSY|nr:BppU family phage baseplate upper protein [[Clostridium] symbiosum]MDB1980077.1 BppU family phage baseplate upper protein [[Clostridium] symbiosum]MDB1984638.1 BppU family phage baseplate upper protein [[Clostridium] symbiosum]MDB1989211.1 BppU family phage baseplate upper protein [[Clostridium] symbiosum]MDB1993741.1 BppU family phage baseplate upper protein [[Clostridium] symbiosum]MDB1998187.1 BppU family phage baseplate upper protein [[Clostridium] symbiosum]
MTQNVILNLKSPQAMQTDVAFTQGDYGEAKLTIAVKDNEQYITGDTGASISFLRADGNIVTGDLTGTKGMYAYTFKGNELEAAGKIVATVTIKYTGGRVSAAAFAFTVRYNPTYDRKIPAGPYITELEKIKEQAQTYVEYLSALIEQLQPDIGSTALTKADLINGYTQTVAGIKAFDAAAAKTLKELVDGKIDATKIVNNLLSTDASMVLSAALGPIIDQRLTDLLEKYNRLNGDALIIAYPIDINMDTAPGLSQNMIYFYQNHFYIGYSMTVSGKLYGAQLRFGHWLTRPEYRYNQGALWTDWAAL